MNVLRFRPEVAAGLGTPQPCWTFVSACYCVWQQRSAACVDPNLSALLEAKLFFGLWMEPKDKSVDQKKAVRWERLFEYWAARNWGQSKIKPWGPNIR